jgi:membrane-bound lytic murein transglycosylase D
MQQFIRFMVIIVFLNGAVTLAQPAAMNPDIQFCGELLPQHLPTVMDRWSRTLTKQARYADHLLMLKRRSAVVFPIIEAILERHAVPKDFKYLPLLESSLSGRAVSRRGAAGFWQLMPGTARHLGLRVGRRGDERFNIQKSTVAACKYLWELYRELGSWMLVALAYNAGPTYIKQLRNQHPDQHPLTLPFRANETRAYVFQTMAIKELLTRPQDYGDYLAQADQAALGDKTLLASAKERADILAYYETPIATDNEADTQKSETEPNEVVLITETDLEEPNTPTRPTSAFSTTPAILSQTTIESPAKTSGQSLISASDDVLLNRIQTRRIDHEPLREGQLCQFVVVQHGNINGQTISVGDVLYAQVYLLDAGAKRVFLRANKLVNSQNQTLSLNLTAIEKTKQPGVTLPTTDAQTAGWRLAWEQL